MILAIDTAGGLTGLAVWRDGLVAETTWRAERRQTAELLPRLTRLLDDAALSLDDLTGLAVNVGPGSFNGIRVGLTTAQAFALARGLTLVGVNVFEAMAWPYRALGRVGAVVPAGRDQAIAIFEPQGTGIAPLVAPRIVSAIETNEQFTGCRLVVSALDALDLANLPVVTGLAALPRPGTIAEIGARLLATGESWIVEPLYLRAPHITPPKARPPARSGPPEGAR